MSSWYGPKPRVGSFTRVVPAAAGCAVPDPVAVARSDRLGRTQVLRPQVVDTLRAGPPEEEIRRRSLGAVEGELQPLPFPEVQLVHIDLIVPEVDRGLHEIGRAHV